MNVQPLLTLKVSASFLAFEGGVLDRKWQKDKYYKVFARTISVAMMINVQFII